MVVMIGRGLVAGGARIHADMLLDWGILDELVPRAGLLKAANNMAAHYVDKPPVAVQMIKQSVNRIVSALDESIMHMDVDQNLFASTLEDRKVAINAYLSKTAAEFTGN